MKDKISYWARLVPAINASCVMGQLPLFTGSSIPQIAHIADRLDRPTGGSDLIPFAAEDSTIGDEKSMAIELRPFLRWLAGVWIPQKHNQSRS